MKRVLISFLGILSLTGCGQRQPAATVSLQQARQGFQTHLIRKQAAEEPVPTPPPALFRIVHYDAPAGKLAAYLSPDPKDGRKHPAIIWITGGDCNTIGDVWSPAPASNDQTASAYRQAGILMMFPSLRGGNDNPGVREGFFGEVDDVIAAGEYLAKQEFIDPARIYLGGHSTGGTLVLLVAESSDRFRAVFSFGPVENVAGYGPEFLPFNISNRKELELRSPLHWLHAIQVPVFVFEGTVDGNLDCMQAMARACTNPQVHFLSVRGANHFNVLAPINRLIAEKVLHDTGASCNLTFTEQEVNAAFRK